MVRQAAMGCRHLVVGPLGPLHQDGSADIHFIFLHHRTGRERKIPGRRERKRGPLGTDPRGIPRAAVGGTHERVETQPGLDGVCAGRV